MSPASKDSRWMASPYLHQRLIRGRLKLDELDDVQKRLAADAWLIPETEDLSTRYRLRYVSLETHTVCTQACSFCPVSIAPRKPDYMPTELFDRLVEEISHYRDTIEAVTLNNYNEPTADRRYFDPRPRAIRPGAPTGSFTEGARASRLHEGQASRGDHGPHRSRPRGRSTQD